MKNVKLFLCMAIFWSGISIMVTGQPSWQTYYSDMYLNPYTAKLAIGINSAGAKFTVNEPGSLDPFNVTVSSVSRFIVKNDGKIGIGTTSPSYLLQAQGDIYANGGWFRVSGSNGITFQTYGGGFYMNDATWIRTYGSKSFYHNVGTMRTDGTFQVGPSGDRFIVNSSGNVGIGRTAPTSKLEVAGEIYSTTGGFKLPDGTVINDAGDLGSGGVTYWMPATGGIMYDLKVGIGAGATAPLETLHVNGNITGKNIDAQYSNLYRFGGLYLTWDGDTYGTSSQHSIRSTYGDTYGDDITVNSYDNIRMNLDANSNTSESYFEVGHHTTGTDQTLFRIVSPTGNVGIGTTAPNSKLQVVGEIYSSTGGFKLPDGTILDDITDLGGGVTSFWQSGTGGIYYNVGNVGIGTQIPFQKLHLVNRIDGYGATETAIRLTSESGGAYGTQELHSWDIRSYDDGVYNKLVFMRGSVYFQPPEEDDSSEEPTEFSILAELRGNGSFAANGFFSLSSSSYFLAPANPSISLKIAGSANIEGKIGIGSSGFLPTTSLHIISDDPGILLDNTSSENYFSEISFADNGTIKSKLFYNKYNFDLVLENNGNQAIIIENNGLVKINGTLEAEKVEVKANIIPDYVFQKDYNLKPLTEVESYILVNKHLPDVPSASEIEQNGLDIGEMQSVMLRKIEELTLYIIELQNEIEQLKEEKAGE